MQKRYTLKTLNKYLTENGLDLELVPGDGYFYFSGNDAEKMSTQGVYGVYRLNDLTKERWLEEAKSLIENKF